MNHERPLSARSNINIEFAEFIGRLAGLADAGYEFWDKRPYSNRLYYGNGAGDYIARDVLKAFLLALKAPQEQSNGN